MGARPGIQAVVRNYQSLHRLSADDMALDNFVHVFRGDAAIPDRFRINHYIRSVFALIEASGLIGANFAFEPQHCQLLLKQCV